MSNVLKKKKSKWFTTEGPWSVVQEVNFRGKLSLHFQVAAVGRTPALPLVTFDPSDWPERLRRSRSAFSLCACSSSYLMTQKQWMFSECVSKGISWNNTPRIVHNSYIWNSTQHHSGGSAGRAEDGSECLDKIHRFKTGITTFLSLVYLVLLCLTIPDTGTVFFVFVFVCFFTDNCRAEEEGRKSDAGTE